MQSQSLVSILDISIANSNRFVLIAGPDSIENESHAIFMAREISTICKIHNIGYIFKASYDKANRTSIGSFRGVGIKKGLKILDKIRQTMEIPVTTDAHSAKEVKEVAKVVDLIQIPALLSRQTDILLTAGKTGKPVNIKKGQFIAPQNAKSVIDKVKSTGNENVIITERGYMFGYNNVVADMRSLELMKRFGSPVIFDASHTAQYPSSENGVSGGDRSLTPVLARSAIAVGIAGIFIEVHNDPDSAPVDGQSSLNLKDLNNLLFNLNLIDSCVK